jgi:endo-1,4-beta-xylanase
LICFQLPAQSLRELADQRGIRIGAAVDPAHFNEPDYSDTLAREFNQAEPENAMKFGPIHPGPVTYNFGPADAIVAFAQAHGMAVRGHNLVWYNQLPAWLTNGNNTPAQLASILEDHIHTVAGRYAGQLYAWDVVNEAFNSDGTLRSYLWYDSPGIGQQGTGYIEQAFRWAHAADPKAQLFYNDFGAETINTKSDAIFRMAQDFKSRGVPLDGIGLQMHFTTNPGSLASMDANIKRITDLGLQVQITELDVRLPVNPAGVATAASLATEAQIYRDIVTLCLKYARCTAVQTWGFTDKYSWIPGTYPGFGAALEFDAGYQPKPAYTSVQNALQASPPVVSPAGLVNAASYTGGAIAPGEIVLLYGATFGPTTLTFGQADTNGFLPTECAQTRLLFDGVPAPVLYAQVGQIAAVAPFHLGGKTTTQVVYEYQGVSSAPLAVAVVPAAPGVFSDTILDTSFLVVTRDNAARRGNTVFLFLTGGGDTLPPGLDGQILSTPPFPLLTNTPRVTVGGIECPVLYAGNAAGQVAGVTQVNVLIPAEVPPGEQPLALSIGDATAQLGLTVWIK